MQEQNHGFKEKNKKRAVDQRFLYVLIVIAINIAIIIFIVKLLLSRLGDFAIFLK